MAHHDRHPADETELDRDEREMPDDPRGEEEDEFEDEEFEEDEEEGGFGDEDIRARDTTTVDRRFTDEIGSEGGSRGDIEVATDRPAPLTGSEAGTTARPEKREPSFSDRHKGPGY